jgi:hypothetical protein
MPRQPEVGAIWTLSGDSAGSRLRRVGTELSPSRSLFVASLLVEADVPDWEPPSRYDETRDVTVLSDGTPLVECIRPAGTGTLTKSDGEQSDADEAARISMYAGTFTNTAATSESSDSDAHARWGGTQLGTRQLPGDVEKD